MFLLLSKVFIDYNLINLDMNEIHRYIFMTFLNKKDYILINRSPCKLLFIFPNMLARGGEWNFLCSYQIKKIGLMDHLYKLYVGVY